ncbi:MAG TPA: PEP/pyruvate-binding domain-containing protein [Myxococcota bacterium]|nr:PEP/pyruvate-binding domain-containing protein [Myxococcota bacterium]
MDTQSGFRKEHLLMPIRVRDVLLLSSRYDAFVLEEDGHLTEQVFLEYRSLSLSSAPRFTHVTTEYAALSLLQKRHFDLVLIVSRDATPSLLEFGRKVKDIRPDQSVVVLGFESADLSKLKGKIGPDTVDALFVWNGDAKILLAIIKHIEDRLNVDNDIEVAGVRVILVVEDSIRYYSAFLAALYTELMKQSHSLFFEGLNRLQRLLRMRTRPKVLHAKDFEEALDIFDSYQDNMLALISDIGFPRQGEMDREAGIRLARIVRFKLPDLPVLLQSAQKEHQAMAKSLKVQFITKDSPELLYTIRKFLIDYLGFGPFVFRLPDGREVARATDVRELADCIKSVPIESIEYHARRNHFSNWLMARSEFELAEILRPQEVGDFANLEEMRKFTLAALEARFRQVRRGVIADFSVKEFDPENLFQRIGDGSLGGKARGIAFLNHLITSDCGSGRLAGLKIQIPQTFVIATDVYEQFMESSKLWRVASQTLSNAEIQQTFSSCKLPEQLFSNLRVILEQMNGPLAVRSSSLLEDDMLHPFAGIYGTVMIPNIDPDLNVRLRDLCRAIKTVYATTYSSNARSYLENTAHRVEEERMGVIIQQVVGRRHAERFYPDFAGVAQSYNYYPLGPLKADDGVVQAALGLGRLVVDGGQVLRFCPQHPEVLPQFASPALVLKNSQRNFYALDLTRDWSKPDGEFDGNQVELDLSQAMEDGTFRVVGSVYDAQNDRITENFFQAGALVVTFNNILKHQAIPLAPAVSELLHITTQALAMPVELEFACDMGDWGKGKKIGRINEEPVFYPLQVRPIIARHALHEIQPEHFPADRVFCRSTSSLGHGHFTELRDIICVKPEAFDPAATRQIAQEVGRLNEAMHNPGRRYILIGPGRWGSADHWLGIPVHWAQISNARIIVEASPEGYNVDPSQGTHFFHNLTALGLGYFTIPPGACKTEDASGSFVDWDWLAKQPLSRETAYLRHVTPSVPLVAYLDGRNSLGLIAWGDEHDPSAED